MSGVYPGAQLLKYLGFVYAMFRRQLPGCLNAVWQVIQDFDRKWAHHLSLPDQCRLELMRFVALIPLARLDFRLPSSEQVACSDASSSGGGVCASVALSRAGSLAARGRLRDSYQNCARSTGC